MRFLLHYRGPLRSNGSPAHKHELRKNFHRQLGVLWTREPLRRRSDLLRSNEDRRHYSLLRQQGLFTFVPLVTEHMGIVAELSVTILRPEPPGRLITHGGDIDNRLKTLFDALTMPREPQALPPGATPGVDQVPFFYCLLEDDNLVTSVAVRTEQLLEPGISTSDVDLLVEVRTLAVFRTVGNDDLA